MTSVSIILTLLPVALLFVMRSTRGRPIWAVALDVPLAVAADLLSVLLLASLMRLETTILVSRVAWVLACVAWLARRRSIGSRWAWPRALGPREVVAVGLGAAAAVVVCMQVSRPFRIGDHNWHDGLVPLIATQKLPFTNVFEPTEHLHYHYMGDVFAAEVRTLSGNTMTAALALALAHEVAFGLIAAIAALFMLGFGQRGSWAVGLGALAFVLHGPIALYGADGPPFHGYASWSYLVASCRPHVAIAGIMTIGFVGAVWVALTQARVEARASVIATLLAATAVLAVTDEASLGPLGAGLAAAWLVRPKILAGTRPRGLVVFAIMLGTILLTNVAFAGALAGKQVSTVHWVAARLPTLLSAPIMVPMTTKGTGLVLFVEVLPFTLCLVGMVALYVQTRDVEVVALLVLAVVVVASSMTLVLHLEVNGTPSENQRFYVAPFFVTTLPCLWLYPRARRGSLASMAMLLGVGLPAVFTLHWLRAQSQADLGAESSVGNPAIPQNLNEVECRRSAGSRFGENAAVRYIDTNEFFYYYSCRPVFVAGAVRPPWSMKVAPVHDPLGQLRELDAHYVPQGEPLDAICRADPAQPSDVVCSRALKRRSECVPEGNRYLRCSLTAGDRRELLR